MGYNCETCKYQEVRFNELPCRACWHEHNWTPKEEKEKENENMNKSINEYTREELEAELKRRDEEEKASSYRSFAIQHIADALREEAFHYKHLREELKNDTDLSIDFVAADSHFMEKITEYAVVESAASRLKWYGACLYILVFDKHIEFSAADVKDLVADADVFMTQTGKVTTVSVVINGKKIYEFEAENK